MPYLSVVVPCHNEEGSLPRLCSGLQTVLSEHLRTDWEVILVDDASTDGTLSVMGHFNLENPCFKVIHLVERRGQTGSFKAAFKAAGGDYIIRMDGDGQDDPEDLPIFIEKIRQEAELVVGIRKRRKHSPVLRLTSNTFDRLMRFLLSSPLQSHSASFVAFKSHLVKNIPFRKNDHRHLPLIALKRGAQKIAEITVQHHPRTSGRSKYNALKKIVTGIPEVALFLIRYWRGAYDLPERNEATENHEDSTQ